MKENANYLALTLVIPGARGAAPTDSTPAVTTRPQALELLLSRAQRISADADLDRLLCGLFGVTLPPDVDAPIAPMTFALDHGEVPAGYCLRADPVHAIADRDVLRILDPTELSITAAEARDLVVTLNNHFAQDGLQFIAPHPARWYLALPADPQMRTHSLARVIGASLHDYLPFGENGKRWQGILNEAQMLLHEHPVNNAREARGELPINSVWFWGGGSVPSVAQKKWAQVWSDNVVALSLAKLARVPRTGAPTSARAWLHEAITPGEHLVVLPAQVDLASMEAEWFAPLYEALKNKRLQRLTLHVMNGTAYSVDAAVLKRWWIRRRPLAQFLGDEQL